MLVKQEVVVVPEPEPEPVALELEPVARVVPARVVAELAVAVGNSPDRQGRRLRVGALMAGNG